jgi:hypothetical protein
LEQIPGVEVRRIGTGELDENGQEITVPHLGDVVLYLLSTSHAIGARNVTQLAKELGLRQSTVRDWYDKGTAPNLETLTKICIRLGTDVVHFLLQWPEFSDAARTPHRVIFDRMASIVGKPETAEKLLRVLQAQQRFGLLETFIDLKAAELQVHPTYPVRSIDRSNGAQRKKRKNA